MVLQNLGLTALLLGVLVVVHEFGHFLVAKALGVKVLKFSVGFGPRLFGFTRGETDYRLSLLPLGGYVRMAGDIPGEELPPEDAHRGFLAQKPWKRALIVAAGPVFNFIFPALVFFVAFASFPQISARVQSLTPGFPAERAHVKLGDVITSVNGHKVESFGEMKHWLADLYGQEITLGISRDSQAVQVRLTPAQATDTTLLGTASRGMIGVGPQPTPPVLGVPTGSPAAEAGLHTFDWVLSVDGQPVSDRVKLEQALQSATGSTIALKVARFVPAPAPGTMAVLPKGEDVTVARQPGEGLAVIGAESAELYVGYLLPKSAADKAGITVGDRLVALNGRPLTSFIEFELALQNAGEKPFAVTWRHGAQTKTQTLSRQKEVLEAGQEPQSVFGVAGYTSHVEPKVERVRVSVASAFHLAFIALVSSMTMVVKGFGMLLLHKIPLSNLGGPVLIYQQTAQSVKDGAEGFLMFMGSLSISLGVVNLFPIPILDGFHLIAAFWEGIRRRPIPARAREVANMVGLALLIVLMVFAFTNDLRRPM